MPDWQNITSQSLPGWIARWMDRSDLPIFALGSPDMKYVERTRQAVREMDGMSRRRSDSGILELHLPKRLGFAEAKSVMPELLRIAKQEDERDFFETKAINSEVIVAVSESRLPNVGLPVIGPGGRVTVAAETRGTTADIVVRGRARTIASQWRKAQEMHQTIERRIAERAGGHVVESVAGLFGYLELSKYERQLWLRPVFLFSLRIAVVGQGGRRVEWGDTIVEPTTTSNEVGVMDGLGSFAQ